MARTDELKGEQATNTNVIRQLGDYDVWYQHCENCGYDTGKSSLPKENIKRCWRCGRPIKRDFSNRALISPDKED